MPKTLKVRELNKLEDLMYYNCKYLLNSYCGPYTDEDVKQALRIVNDCITNARFDAEVDLY